MFNPNETLKIAEFLPAEQPVIVQLFGYDGDLIAKAAHIVEERIHPAGIDINMGCPAPKITGNECGSGLLRDYGKALELAKIVRKNFSGQLSVKLRLGWRDYDVLDFVKKLEEIGIDAISVHGRTTKQGYSGEANWDAIHEIASAVAIPIIGNGDITTMKVANERLKGSNLAGVMIGRGALGNPWIFSASKPDKAELKGVILDQTLRTIDYLGNEERAIREMRKHFGWYLKGFPGAQELRKKAVVLNTLDELKELLTSLN